MRIVFSFFIITSFLFTSNTVAAQYNLTNDFIQFDIKLIDLGEVRKGSKVDSTFTFTNISDEDIRIELVSTCDCTEADWPYDVIAPGEQGVIEFTFDSNKKEMDDTVALDVILENVDQKTGDQVFDIVEFKYNLVEIKP